MTAWGPDMEFIDNQRLVRLGDGAESKLNKYEEFLKGDYEAIPRSELEPHVTETDVTADLRSLDAELRKIVEKTDAETPDSDPAAAPEIHRNVNISRSEASDSGLWSAFSMLYFPWYVHHRWPFNTVSAMKEKFWTQARALDGKASTFERAWWIAELTCVKNPDGSTNYEPTRRALSKRRFSLLVFDTPMARYEPAVRALLEVLYDEPESDEADSHDGSLADNDVIDETIKRFRKSGSVFPYEGQTKDELAGTLRDIRQEVEADST